jgi:hypothetical protein
VLLTASVVYGRRPRRLAGGGLPVRTLAFLATVTAILAIIVFPQTARADATSSLVSSTNQARAASGLPALASSADLAAAARRQAASMAGSGVLSHTPGLGSAVCCWVNLGENVGEGPSAAAIHAAFMASPGHRANILNRAYTQIGVGYAVDSRGMLWVSEIFRRPNNVAPPAAAAPVTKPAPVHPAAPAPARKALPPAPVNAAPAGPAVPAVDPGLAASRDLNRVSLEEAQRYAAQFATDGPPRGTNPVSRLLDFAAKAAAPN